MTVLPFCLDVKSQLFSKPCFWQTCHWWNDIKNLRTERKIMVVGCLLYITHFCWEGKILPLPSQRFFFFFFWLDLRVKLTKDRLAEKIIDIYLILVSYDTGAFIRNEDPDHLGVSVGWASAFGAGHGLRVLGLSPESGSHLGRESSSLSSSACISA